MDPRYIAEKEARFAADMLHRDGWDTTERLADASRAVNALHVPLEHATRHRNECQQAQDEFDAECGQLAKESADERVYYGGRS